MYFIEKKGFFFFFFLSFMFAIINTEKPKRNYSANSSSCQEANFQIVLRVIA